MDPLQTANKAAKDLEYAINTRKQNGINLLITKLKVSKAIVDIK